VLPIWSGDVLRPFGSNTVEKTLAPAANPAQGLVGAAVLRSRLVIGAVSVSQLTSDPETRESEDVGPRAVAATAISRLLGAPV